MSLKEMIYSVGMINNLF